MTDKATQAMVAALLQQQARMPFPDNQNPDMMFANRWPQNLPPSGILNDLQPQTQSPPLMRRLPNG